MLLYAMHEAIGEGSNNCGAVILRPKRVVVTSLDGRSPSSSGLGMVVVEDSLVLSDDGAGFFKLDEESHSWMNCEGKSCRRVFGVKE